jgi:hypothetical protein
MFNPTNKGDVMSEDGIAIYELADREIDFISGGGVAYDWGLEAGRAVRSFFSGWGERFREFSENHQFFPAW